MARGACGSLLRELRQAMGEVSQETLARAIGVSWSTINRWESGKGSPSPLAREKLLALLKQHGLQARGAELDEK